MGEIKNFTESDVPEVAALWLRVFRRRTGPPGRDLEEYFREILLSNPWIDKELPSSMYIDSGRIVGFVGIVPRPMTFLGRPIRVAVTTQLIADPEYRGLAGLKLLRHVFQGPQDLTFTDGASEAGSAAWIAAGGRISRLYSLQWKRVLRPATYFHSLSKKRKRSALFRMGSKSVPSLFALTDKVVAHLPFRVFSPPLAKLSSQPVNSDDLLGAINKLGWQDALQPAYEANSFGWLMTQAAAAGTQGTLRMAVVHEPQGSPAGWYVYYAKPGFDSLVLQIGGRRRHFDDIFVALMQDAWAQDASCVSGAVVPRYLPNLTNQHCILRHGAGVMIHTRDPHVMDCIQHGEAALTRLDGEWWMRFAIENWS